MISIGIPAFCDLHARRASSSLQADNLHLAEEKAKDDDNAYYQSLQAEKLAAWPDYEPTEVVKYATHLPVIKITNENGHVDKFTYNKIATEMFRDAMAKQNDMLYFGMQRSVSVPIGGARLVLFSSKSRKFLFLKTFSVEKFELVELESDHEGDAVVELMRILQNPDNVPMSITLEEYVTFF